MTNVNRNDFPVSTLFRYEIKGRGIELDLSGVNETDKGHIKKAKNSIFWAIILFCKYGQGGKLEKIKFTYRSERQKDLILPLLANQMPYFGLEFDGGLPEECTQQKFLFPQEWSKNIQKNIKKDLEGVGKYLLNCKLPNIESIQFYNAIKRSAIQLGFWGYRIGKWNGREIIPENDKKNKGFVGWAKELMGGRINPESEYYKAKPEHYLEAKLLALLYTQKMYIGKNRFSPLFENCKIAFQFPALLRRGDAEKSGNSPGYIDILAKSYNRPVILELKVWRPKGNSRGEYAFEAMSQVLSYYNYLKEVSDCDENFKAISGFKELLWDKPLLYVVINNIGDDKRAEVFRGYVNEIKKYLRKDIEFYFAEIPSRKWEKSRTVIPEEIICI